MPKIKYESKSFIKRNLALIEDINKIIDEYRDKGYSLSLRQVYYQLVARDKITNCKKSYNSIKELVKNARLAGLIDWYAITDRTRYLRSYTVWDDPEEIIKSASRSLKLDLWQGQPCYIEAWCEKDALIDIVGNACDPTRTPYFACRGYPSTTELWRAAQRLAKITDREKIILYCGDHDPTGMNIPEVIQQDLSIFGANGVQVQRIALNMNQVEQYNPPPNFAKDTDTRYDQYEPKYGKTCWELDALTPDVINDLIQEKIIQYLDIGQFEKMKAEEQEQQAELFSIANDCLEAMQRAKGANA